MNAEVKKLTLLVAPLNWGLGHATRCIPIIKALIENGFNVVLASDGEALKLLQIEFPNLKSYELPSYKIEYAKNGNFLKYKLLFQFFKIKRQVKAEKKVVDSIIQKEQITGIISDNRFGIYNKTIPNVYITHQVNVFSGIFTFLTSYIHRKIIEKFDVCWIPDHKTQPQLAGKLNDATKLKIPSKYIGILSRFKPQKTLIKNDILVLLSGVEPQRTIIENTLLQELKKINKKIVFVRGIIDTNDHIENTTNIEFFNFLNQQELNKVILESNLVIARSGYSTIMDLAKLKKRVLFIPTKGQAEQEYLAKYLKQQNLAPYCKQDGFNLKLLDTINDFEGFTNFNNSENTFDFSLFKTKI